MTGPALRRALAVGAVGLQLAVLYAPTVPSVPTGGIEIDKVVHCSVFALATLLPVTAGVRAAPWVAAMALHAPLSEVIQGTFYAHRSQDPRDVAADLVGVGIAVGVLAVRRRARSSDVG